MLSKRYSNFVRPTSPRESTNTSSIPITLSGDEAMKIYLEEIKVAKLLTKSKYRNRYISRTTEINQSGDIQTNVTDKELFLCVQNNEVIALKQILDYCPDKINTVDEYGWSLLMIACQANSIDTAKELVKRGINTSVRDRAGNSASSIVIKNKNLVLADLLLSRKTKNHLEYKKSKNITVKSNETFICEICNNMSFPDKEAHLSSTLHNISASKGKKLPNNYAIPESNRGYQIMLKVGWDKDSGLGPDGAGKKYPIKAVQKKDRKGLGHEKRKKDDINENTAKHKNKKLLAREHQNLKKMEINFRREFY